MKRTLQALAGLVCVGALATWLATGAHRGWTATSVRKLVLDEVTGIESPTYEKHFVAGVDFLAAAFAAAGAVALASLFLRDRPLEKSKN